MPLPQPHYSVYREQLTSLYHGHALWDPDPANLYDMVSVGDVGYVREGYFFRMFNVLLKSDHPSNRIIGEPDPYEPVDLGPFVNVRVSRLSRGDYHSRYVSTQEHNIGVQAQAPRTPADSNPITSFRCRKKLGAFLSLPYDGYREDVIRTKAFEDYIRDHCESWFTFAQRNRLDVQRMEDIILVSGCTLVTAWAAAAFVDNNVDSEITLGSQQLGDSGATFQWHFARENRQSVAYNNSQERPDPPQTQCVFIRGFRAKRIFLGLYTGLRAAAEPLPDNPDRRGDGEMQVTRVPNVPSYRDPLIGVLDYIAETVQKKGTDSVIGIAHDDDLQLIEEVETLTADAVEGFLRQNEINVLIENGAAILHDDEDPGVPEDAKAIFYAHAELEGELIPLVLHPALSKYFIKLDISNQSGGGDDDVDDFGLPQEEVTSSAVHPPVLSLKLENHQGYPQDIHIHASGDSQSVGITVRDMLKTINEDARKISRKIGVDAAFRERCTTEEELGHGPCRIDYLRRRDRLQILPKLSPDGEMLPLPTIPAEPSVESNVAGPSRIPIR
ncbi:hypothetical protein EI94DRAFT_1748313 [Lactarius quietus]|nr:hypothetical protein EI94DRAFT_1748313 [Lactarius quietus]